MLTAITPSDFAFRKSLRTQRPEFPSVPVHYGFPNSGHLLPYIYFYIFSHFKNNLKNIDPRSLGLSWHYKAFLFLFFYFFFGGDFFFFNEDLESDAYV